MNPRVPTVLLGYDDPELSSLVSEVLEQAGYRVIIQPPDADLVAYAARTQPDVIISSVNPIDPGNLAVLDQLRLDSATCGIPVVAISTSVTTAAEAQASPNVPDALVAPFDLDELEDAVATALKTPPPAAALPPAAQPAPAHVRLATDALISQARLLAIHAIRALQRQESYRARFRRISPELVDHVGLVFGGIVNGLQRMLPPAGVFAVPEIRRSIHEHVTLRRDQGLGPAAAIEEYQLLQSDVDQFLQSLIGRSGIDSADAFDVSRRLAPYFDELIRIVASEYWDRVTPGPGPTASTGDVGPGPGSDPVESKLPCRHDSHV